MVGLLYAYKISNDEKYLKKTVEILSFIQNNIKDIKHGEWFWKVNKNGEPDRNQYKMGMWKAPYHNSRGFIMLQKLLTS